MTPFNQADFGPTNIRYGDLALFTAEFFDDDNVTTTPDGATLSVTYTNLAGAEQTDLLSMAVNDGFLGCIWSSTGATLGLGVWSVISVGNSTAAQLGTIRVVNSGLLPSENPGLTIADIEAFTRGVKTTRAKVSIVITSSADAGVPEAGVTLFGAFQPTAFQGDAFQI